jgi:hypothetical protein
LSLVPPQHENELSWCTLTKGERKRNGKGKQRGTRKEKGDINGKNGSQDI